MSTYTNFVSPSKIRYPLVLPTHSLRRETFYHTIRRLINTNIIIIIVLVFAVDIQSGRNVANAEYFSSVDSLQKLGDIEMGLVKTFQDYLELQDREFESYRRFIEDVKLQHSIAEEGVEDYLGNPINAFTLIKRMVTDWNNLHEFIKQSQARNVFQENLNKFTAEKGIPDDSELSGAVKGLARLQKIYNLHTYDLANGQINGVDTGTDLSWHDCFEIATHLYDQNELQLALTWFEMTFRKLNEIDSKRKDPTLSRFEIETIEYMALSNYELGNSEKAIEYIDEILKIAPNHHSKDIKTYIMNSPPKQPPPINPIENFNFYPNYTRLCQGVQIPEKRLNKLRCTLETRSSPQFILAPLRVEELCRDPQIKVYHGLLTERQIDQIITEAEGNMFRSHVQGGTSGIISDVRVSQQAWLGYESKVMQYVRRMVSEITGLDLDNAESMQMANYGIGGQYEPHNDFFGRSLDNSKWEGDRIATNMFYLSNVELGGFTVFPKINIYSRPIKGSMVSWYNLHKSVDPDYRTLHAGCPVATGSKRIGNVWIHSGHQEFRRPCGLKSDTYKSQIYK